MHPFMAAELGPLFTVEERAEMIKKAVEHLPNVEVRDYDTLTVNFAKKVGAQVIIRGLRTGSDFEYEFEMAYMNKKLAPDIEFVCLMTSLEYAFLSATTLKEVAYLGGDICSLTPAHVQDALRNRFAVAGRSGGPPMQLSALRD